MPGNISAATLIRQFDMQGALPAKNLQRIANRFEEHLGRKLTPEQRKYLGISGSVEPIHYRELQGEKQEHEKEEETYREESGKPERASLD